MTWFPRIQTIHSSLLTTNTLKFFKGKLKTYMWGELFRPSLESQSRAFLFTEHLITVPSHFSVLQWPGENTDFSSMLQNKWGQSLKYFTSSPPNCHGHFNQGWGGGAGDGLPKGSWRPDELSILKVGIVGSNRKPKVWGNTRKPHYGV